MEAIRYLYRRTLANRFRKALRKPITYFYLVIIVFYVMSIPFSFRMMAQDFGLDSPGGMSMVLTALAFLILPGNLAAFAKRKGMVYRGSDAHFLFQAPISPKKILLYAYLKTLVGGMILFLFSLICGVAVFGVRLWQLALLAVFELLSYVTDACIMLLLYGSERIGERGRRLITRAAYGLMGLLAAIGLYHYLSMGFSGAMAAAFLQSDAVKLVPLVGWYVSVIQLILGGVSLCSAIGAALYFVLLAAVLIGAVRMKCTGGFYEDAAKFADDYEEAVAKQRQGGVRVTFIGRKQKFKRAGIRWQGTGARAIFYRQLLEYKKNRFFIFGPSTLASLAAGIGIAWLYVREGGFGEGEPFVIPGVSAYITFIFTALNGKWAKELKSPYTYLIPDSAFAKLWNATALQVLQCLVNALLITLPGAVVMGTAPFTAALCVVACAVFAANKLYALAVAEIVVGGIFGVTGKQFFQLFIQAFVLLGAVLGAAIGFALGGLVLAYCVMDIMLILFTAVFMAVAALNFYKMETG